MAWWSGFFAVLALVHIIRLITRVVIQLNGWSVPMSVSIGVAAVAGVLSILFCKKGCGACGCASK